MRVRTAMLGLGFVFAVAAVQAVSQETPRKPNATTEEDSKGVPVVSNEQPMSFWMEKKLDYSKAILESLTKGEYAQLAEDAEKMRLLGKIEGFVRRKNPDYRLQLRNFDLATTELTRQASRHNAEGAALAFNQLTNSCVACHVMLREGLE